MKDMAKTDLKNNKKASFTEKWEERRNEIEKKKLAEQKQLNEAEKGRKSFTRLELRPRVKTEAPAQLTKRPNLPYSAFNAKRQIHRAKNFKAGKIKTEFE